MLGKDGGDFGGYLREAGERADRQQRAFMGCAMLLGLGWLALLAVLILSASHWLLTH